jgi:hypothetical protein
LIPLDEQVAELSAPEAKVEQQKLPVNFFNLFLKVTHTGFPAIVFNKSKKSTIRNLNLRMIVELC